MDRPVIDHRGPEFGRLGAETLEGLQAMFKTSGPVVTYPGSASGAWEAALVNVLSPGDRVLMFETGLLAALRRPAQAGRRPGRARSVRGLNRRRCDIWTSVSRDRNKEGKS